MFQHRPVPEALIFDLDGLLLDTERVNRGAFEAGLPRSWLAISRHDRLADCIGTTGSNVETILRKGYGPDFPWEAVRTIWRQRYLDRMENRPADVKPGAIELLVQASKEEIPCGVATFTHSSLTATKLTLSGLDSCFSVVDALLET